MSTGRIQMDAVIMADGNVLALGGSVNSESPDGPGKTADLYHPGTNTFSSAGTASPPHSIFRPRCGRHPEDASSRHVEGVACITLAPLAKSAAFS